VVRVLIDLRRTVVRHQLAGAHPAAVVATLLLALLSAVGTLLLGWVRYPHAATASDVLALVWMLWVGGRLAQCALTGEPVLRPELFALLPLPRRRLGRALLVVGLLDPANVLLAVALAGAVRVGARLGPAATVVAVVGIVLTVLLTSVLATLVAGLLGPGSRRGHDAGTVVTALLISVIAVAGTLLPALISALRDRSAGWLSGVLRVLPSGWGPWAVESAGDSNVVGALLPLLGLLALTGLVVLAWPFVLSRRMQGRQPVRHGAGTTDRAERRLLGSSPTAAIAAKELRLWVRDPIRLTCLLVALVVGTASCVLPRVTSGTDLLLPFGGAMTVVIAGACACNLYGNDGSSVWLTVLTPGSAGADVRGRQLAWLLAVAPYAVVSTVLLTAIDGRSQYWPWAIALLAALLGGGAGVAAYGSLVFVQPLDESGGPTPAWSLKVHAALLAVAATAAPPLVLLLVGWHWVAVPVGALTGVAFAIGLGRRATVRLARGQVGLLATLA
jgi:ABC-2 type transport system permease protein